MTMEVLHLPNEACERTARDVRKVFVEVVEITKTAVKAAQTVEPCPVDLVVKATAEPCQAAAAQETTAVELCDDPKAT